MPYEENGQKDNVKHFITWLRINSMIYHANSNLICTLYQNSTKLGFVSIKEA